ncbi:type 2C protein phosphatase [Saccharomycopsis crataegensis]|uniref:Type 2C protein phosphatase n=1 Tax=Saccharomycopsis crataegensis TaxID=43959 RepID=A0AAV5QSJ5_9ASCO|nr:type 2C protein phosphatase [Saccharomycopsis crataegensis]
MIRSARSRHPSVPSSRNVSSYLYFNVPTTSFIKSSSNSNITNRQGKFHAKFKIPLLKSGQYLGHYTSRLNRVYNEDAYNASVITLPPNSYNLNIGAWKKKCYINDNSSSISTTRENLQVFNFGVYDGHGGSLISKYLAANLSGEIEAFQTANLGQEYFEDVVSRYYDFFYEKSQKNTKGLETKADAPKGSYWNKWLRYMQKNYQRLYKENLNSVDDLALRLFLVYLSLDIKLLEHPELLDPRLEKFDIPSGGSTATSVFLHNILSNSPSNLYFDDSSIAKLIVAHLGDTKCILVDKFGNSHALTSDHHPDSSVENMRLTKLATEVGVNVDSFGEERFWNLANTRAFGDFNVKNKGVIAEPDIKSFIVGNSNYIAKHAPELKPQTIGGIGGDECFIVLVSDGVTNYCNDQEIADLIMSNYNLKGAERGTPQSGAEEVVRYIETVGGDDNATCLVIRLNGWGKWPIIDRTGKMREEKLNDAVFANRRSGRG